MKTYQVEIVSEVAVIHVEAESEGAARALAETLWFIDGDAFEWVRLESPDWVEVTSEFFTVGHVTDKELPITYHETRAEAEARIEFLQRHDPEGVARGDYYIDGPEDVYA